MEGFAPFGDSALIFHVDRNSEVGGFGWCMM